MEKRRSFAPEELRALLVEVKRFREAGRVDDFVEVTGHVMAAAEAMGWRRLRAPEAPPDGGGRGRGGARNLACEENNGPDFHFDSAPILATLPSGNQVIVACQKSGWVWAFDPDKQGAIPWKYRATETDTPPPGIFGGVVWGQAVDGNQMYVPVSDIQAPSRAVGLRAYSTKDGTVLWTFDTNTSVETVNKVKANAGSLIGPGAVVADGMVYVTSGYGSHSGRAGNVLLVFGVD